MDNHKVYQVETRDEDLSPLYYTVGESGVVEILQSSHGSMGGENYFIICLESGDRMEIYNNSLYKVWKKPLPKNGN